MHEYQKKNEISMNLYFLVQKITHFLFENLKYFLLFFKKVSIRNLVSYSDWNLIISVTT